MSQELETSPSPLLPPEPEEDLREDRETRQIWLNALELEDKDEILFLFELLLTAMDRYFFLRNHPYSRSREEGIGVDLRVEVEIADRKLRQLVQLVEKLLKSARAEEVVFRSYVETHLLNDLDREYLISRRFRQATPFESLYFLLMGLRSLIFLCAGLLESKKVEIPVFQSLGQQYMILILSNRFFNPLKLRGFSAILDRVSQPEILRIIKTIQEEELRKATSVIILILYRYLRVLRWVLPTVYSRENLLDTLPWFTFLSSELRTFATFLENQKKNLERGPSPLALRLINTLDTLGFQFSLETKKVYHQVLRDFTHLDRIPRLRVAVETAHGVLNNLFQQAILSVLQVFEPGLQGKEIFPDFISRFEQSFRLRQDLWVFEELLREIIAVIESESSDPFTRRQKYHRLLEYIRYFENFSFHFVRYSEHEAFQSFFEAMRDLRSEPFIQVGRCKEIARTMEHFRIFLETVIGFVSQRAELAGHPLDTETARSVLREWLKEE